MKGLITGYRRYSDDWDNIYYCVVVSYSTIVSHQIIDSIYERNVATIPIYGKKEVSLEVHPNDLALLNKIIQEGKEFEFETDGSHITFPKKEELWCFEK